MNIFDIDSNTQNGRVVIIGHGGGEIVETAIKEAAMLHSTSDKVVIVNVDAIGEKNRKSLNEIIMDNYSHKLELTLPIIPPYEKPLTNREIAEIKGKKFYDHFYKKNKR